MNQRRPLLEYSTTVASSTAGTVVFFKKRIQRSHDGSFVRATSQWERLGLWFDGSLVIIIAARRPGWLSLGVLHAWQVDQDGRRPTCRWTEVFFPISRSKETAWYSITADIYLFFYFWWMLAYQLLRWRSAKHGMCWMSHTSAKGVWHEQRGRASPLLGRRLHVVVLVVWTIKSVTRRERHV